MKTEPTPTTAAELLSEHIRLTLFLSDEVRLVSDPVKWAEKAPCIMKRRDEIAARLDEMCDNAGIYLHSGRFCYRKMAATLVLIGGTWLSESRTEAREQQALQEWLLIKENHGK